MSIEKNVMYHGNVISCNGDVLQINVNSNIINVHIFNVLLEEDVCPLVYNAQEVRFEVGEYGTVEKEVSAYIFLDDELLQKTIINSGMGKIKIDNPLYEYYDELHEEIIEVSSNELEASTERQYERGRANTIICIMTIVYVIFLIIIFRKKVQKFIKF